MSDRIIHLLHSECEIHVQRIGKDTVRVRITEKNPELVNPTDFEVEGSSQHISEAFSTIAAVLVNLDEMLMKEPN